MDDFRNTIVCGDSNVELQTLPDNCIDLTVTSPPYDDLRTYNGYSFDFESMAHELFRVTKQGGAVVWIVGNSVKDGSERCTYAKQLIHFNDQVGFNVHQTIIWDKRSFAMPCKNRYHRTHEHMFVFSKGKIATCNLLHDRKNKTFGKIAKSVVRERDGSLTQRSPKLISEHGIRFDVWKQGTEKQNNGHPAPFPVQLAIDHILSWSNEGDLVLDPFMGSGTTAIAALQTGRDYLGIEISEDYCISARERLDKKIGLFKPLLQYTK